MAAVLNMARFSKLYSIICIKNLKVNPKIPKDPILTWNLLHHRKYLTFNSKPEIFSSTYWHRKVLSNELKFSLFFPTVIFAHSNSEKYVLGNWLKQCILAWISHCPIICYSKRVGTPFRAHFRRPSYLPERTSVPNIRRPLANPSGLENMLLGADWNDFWRRVGPLQSTLGTLAWDQGWMFSDQRSWTSKILFN